MVKIIGFAPPALPLAPPLGNPESATDWCSYPSESEKDVLSSKFFCSVSANTTMRNLVLLHVMLS